MIRYSVLPRESMWQRFEPEERGSDDFHNAVCTTGRGKGRVRLTRVSDIPQESSGASMPWKDVPQRRSAVGSNQTISVHSRAMTDVSFVPLRNYGFELNGSNGSPGRGSKSIPALL